MQFETERSCNLAFTSYPLAKSAIITHHLLLRLLMKLVFSLVA